ncbi:hypothetical protein IAU59_004730 [Kwoniella sp. CBS 9459]
MLLRLALLFLVLVTLVWAAPASIPLSLPKSDVSSAADRGEILGSTTIKIPARLNKALHLADDEDGSEEEGFSVWSRCDVEGTSTLLFTSQDLEGLTEHEIVKVRDHAYHHDLCRKFDLDKRKKKKKKSKGKIVFEEEKDKNENETSASGRRVRVSIDSGFNGLGISVAISFSIGIGGFWSLW